MDMLFFIVSFLASIAGAICGIGGVAGMQLFSAVKAFFGGSSAVGGVQAIALGIKL